MSQQHHDQGPRPHASPARAGATGGATDLWESLLAGEDAGNAVAVEPMPAGPSAAELDELPDPDAMALFHAEANAAAVEAAAVLRAESGDEVSIEQMRARRRSGGGAFTIPLLCAGIGLIAACLLIPQVDANRRLVYERLKLQNDLESVEKQVDVNDQFLRMVSNDANLAERLAQRQMKIIRKGSEVLNLKSDTREEMSPFQLTAVPAAAEIPPFKPLGGNVAELAYNPKTRLYLMGVGLLAVAVGLVMGAAPKPQD
jgi:hypothetical protein